MVSNLAKDREESATMLEKPSMSGIKNRVVDQYSDQAHFIYELLQNANDARATKTSFKLTSEGLYFTHNGTILFSVSNPETEDQDKKKNTLGHINSITAIANSNKTESSVGKFGVGFKAVFQYTDTPHIYDPSFQFKIERFIIPVKLDNDLKGRQKDETVFYFPFNKEKMLPEKAYTDILEKFKNLVYPNLFLSYLNEVKWQAGNETGEYTKQSSAKQITNNIVFQKIELYQNIGLSQTKERLYLFARSNQENYIYSVGYFLDENDKLIPKQCSAFCFFSTRETTNLNFILHAPFLLTESRESIKRFEAHNGEMVNLLAQLAADSLLILKELRLINDNIVKIIPYRHPDKDDFFAPFYGAIKEKFKTEKLLPTINNYTGSENAYWAEDKPVLNLFSDNQLAMLIDEEDAKWVFRGLVRNQTGNDNDLRRYIDNCISNYYSVGELLDNINVDFIEQQSDQWLHSLYRFLSKNNSYWDDLKTKPIFLNTEREAVPAFEKNGKDYYGILFLPSENLSSSEKTICPDLLKVEKSKEFFEGFGIKQPSIKDEIYNHILPLYDTDEIVETESHFKLFFKYWKQNGRPEDFINLIKEKSFILFKTKSEESHFRSKASKIYYPTLELQKYFETKLETKFVDLEIYYKFIKSEKDQNLLKEFLLKLGVSELPRILEREITDSDEKNNIKSVMGNSLKSSSAGHYGQGTFDKIIDGCIEIIENIDKEKSLLLWMNLIKLKISKLEGKHRYFRYAQYCQYFESTTLKLLKTSKWLLSVNNELVAPTEITIDELANLYEKNSDLENLLSFKPAVVLSKAERIAQKFENEDEAELAKRLLEEFNSRQIIKANSRNFDNNLNELEDGKSPKVSKIERTIKDLDDLQNQFTPEPKTKNDNKFVGDISMIDFDHDEEFSKGIEDLKKQLEIKKNRVDLADVISKSVKYSYDWFLAYLKLLTTYGEKQETSKQQSISFQDIKPFKSDNKYFLLCGSSSYISTEVENAEDFKVTLVFANGKKENIIVEGVSKKGQDLLIYCRESLSSNILSRLKHIFKVEINFTPVIDLLDRLYKAFNNRNNIDSWQDINEVMPSLNYIYGPPGTGKTTKLCNNISDVLATNPSAKILVLTPTNKAADVICKKLTNINNDIYAIRLSKPTDPELEEQSIYREMLDSEDMNKINVLASTIHRLPYFEIQELGLLFQYEWDYVIFDESSMTGLHYITFAIMTLFKTNPNANFIIAGDPKQIPPVIEINEKELENFDFQDESIYKMMALESFNPKEQVIREIDTIENLKKQYRSIPEIGQLFSELSYSSLLEHDRAINRNETKQLPEEFKKMISSKVTFIDVPLNQDNSIYKVNKLFYSSYHTYSAIIVSEIIKYFEMCNKVEHWTIGLIAPYKAQAILLNKLITSYGISENIKVYSDTVHGFQGDECDIIFFICNPNNYFYSGNEKALLSKEYIYNVAISRAKDYLIIIHPYSTISNPFINEISLSYRNSFGNTEILNCSDIEFKLFNDKKFIEKNSYVSGHDSVNVFGLTEMKYFIKSDDTAIDIQLRDIKK